MNPAHVLALICIGLRLAIPAGYMVESASSRNSSWPLVLCTGEGAWAGPAHRHDRGAMHDHGAGRDHEACPFAVLYAPVSGTPDDAALAAPMSYQNPAEPPVAAQRRPGLAAPPPPASGPPDLL